VLHFLGATGLDELGRTIVLLRTSGLVIERTLNFAVQAFGAGWPSFTARFESPTIYTGLPQWRCRLTFSVTLPHMSTEGVARNKDWRLVKKCSWEIHKDFLHTFAQISGHRLDTEKTFAGHVALCGDSGAPSADSLRRSLENHN
jgi:hypothetical protein